jgi:hypothetical protein
MRRVAFVWMVVCGAVAAVSMAANHETSSGRIDPAADRVLRRMCRYLQAQRQFHIAATEHFDVVRDSGQRIQYCNFRDVTIVRPNKIYSDVVGDTLNRRFWYDGKTATMLDKQRKLYSQVPAPPTIDATLDYLAEHYGLAVPLSDLVFSDPYAELTEKVTSGAYLGLHTVDQIQTHHLAFTQENLDWQIWIDAGAAPVPRRVVITYKQQPGQPQYQATLYDWSSGEHVSVSNALFHFHPPKGAARIEMVPVGGAPHHLKALPQPATAERQPSQ